MDSSSPRQLSLKQKVQLAAGVFAIYWPIRLYYNVNEWDWAFLQEAWKLWVVEIPLTMLFFIGWLSVTEWLEGKIFNRSGRDSLIQLNWSAQIATLLVATTLALVFNLIFLSITRQVYGRVARQETRIKLGEDIPPSSTRRGAGRPRRFDQRQKANNGLTIMAMLMAFYLAANRRSTRRIQQLQLQAERLEKEAVQAQFDALKNQVNPHFLFNSLSILASLIDTDAKLAGQFLNRLAKAYRYILEQKDNERVSLRTELDFITAYTFLLTIRFEDKLFVAIEVPEAARDRYQIAPLTLQLLVENAVKHNRLSEEEPLRVSIVLEGDCLRVTNLIQPRPDRESSTGIGLQNITNRYRLLTSRPVWVGEEEGAFVVKLPLL